jgi:hypothetical protein
LTAGGNYQEREELFNDHQHSLNKVDVLAARIRDRSVREFAVSLKTNSSRLRWCKSEDEVPILMKQITEDFDIVNNSIGQVLREIDEDES